MNFKIKLYKGCQIHYVHGTYKYDIYDDAGRWVGSDNTLRNCIRGINNLIFTRKNIPY